MPFNAKFVDIFVFILIQAAQTPEENKKLNQPTRCFMNTMSIFLTLWSSNKKSALLSLFQNHIILLVHAILHHKLETHEIQRAVSDKKNSNFL